MTTLRAVLFVVASGLALTACARDHEVAEAASNAAIGIQTTQLFVTIENKAGTALMDLSAVIQAPGAPPYTHLITRLESGEKRDVPLSDFSSRDGTTFNLRMVRPRTVRVSAVDLTGKKYSVEAPWK